MLDEVWKQKLNEAHFVLKFYFSDVFLPMGWRKLSAAKKKSLGCVFLFSHFMFV
jgi:hypothetical protein